MDKSKIKITVLDPNGANENTVMVGKDAKIDAVIKANVAKFNLPTNISYDAILKRTNTNITPGMTVGAAGIQEGDVLRLRTTQEGGNY